MNDTIYYTDELTGREFKIKVELQFYKENYGADADGNRGELRTECEVDDFYLYEEVQTMPLWIFKIRNLFDKKVKAWKYVERREGDLPEDLENRISDYIFDYDYEETECKGYYDKDDDGDRRYDEWKDEQ